MYSLNSICVCGAGTMGSGIAQLVAQNGFPIILFDVNENVLTKSKNIITKSLETLVNKGKLTTKQLISIFSNIHFTTNIQHCKADIIIEAIIEILEAKIDLFQQLAAINSSSTIFATNTSSIAVTTIAKAIANPERVVGLHFFNPATIMKLVEIITAEQTNHAVVEALINLSYKLQKTPVVCKDAPGFIVNRVARHYYLEAMKLVELGLSELVTVDAVMEANGFKMGPFKLMDLIGNDINFGVSQIVYDALDKPSRLKPSILQQEKVVAGHFGKKTGKGFYEY